jgi:DNA-directed RNA polymerase omega subunit
MFRVSTEKLMEESGGKYTLLEMAFQRTRQLNNGALPTVKTTSKKNGMIALQEIAEGKVRLATGEEDEPETAEE